MLIDFEDFFNPGWEVEIGSSKGQLTHRNVFKRKVDPIVNGITDMQKFSPVTEIKTKQPTVTMLSHVWFAKDIKTALLAADIISNEWGFKDYKLEIYGALNKAPVYSSECQEILACKGLGQSVALKGTADPAMVLANTWLFLNSSVSEGLPLALGEAALTGAPVVCTDVGASLRVLTDPDDGKRYSEVVAPNDAYGLARAQINLLAMLDEWTQYADDPPDKPAPTLPHKPTPHDVEIITRRMYDKTDQRRKLGMMARSIVQKSFGGERYLREHEQMLWIGKACYEMLGLEKRTPPLRNPSRALASVRQNAADTALSNIIDLQLEKMQHPRPPLARHLSAATSFSSIYMDPPPAGPSQHLYYADVNIKNYWGPQTPDSSIHYDANSKKSSYRANDKGYEESYFMPNSKPPPTNINNSNNNAIQHPPRAYARNKTPSPPSRPPVAVGKRPVQYGYGYGHAGGFKHVPANVNVNGNEEGHVVPKMDARRSALIRQSVVGGGSYAGSAMSSGRGRSHLNEVELAEYYVDGRL
jgi:hypothetical protein